MGRLVVVGTGIRSGHQLTPEARRSIAAADHVLYLVTEPLTSHIIEDLNPQAQSLDSLYAPTKDRSITYAEMVDAIMDSVRRGGTVCAVFYGHPGVFVTPGHMAIHQARTEGHAAEMLPGISAEDCLFADLGVDPGAAGCQSFTGHDFLVRPRKFDTHTPLILWQIVGIGDPAVRVERDPRGIEELAALLAFHYGPSHQVTLYVAAVYPVGEHYANQVAIDELPGAEIPELTSLYVPPLGEPEVDADMLARLGLSSEYESANSATAS